MLSTSKTRLNYWPIIAIIRMIFILWIMKSYSAISTESPLLRNVATIINSTLLLARYVNQQVKGWVKDKIILLCGLSPIVNLLIAQFNTPGVSNNQIIVEGFNLA